MNFLTLIWDLIFARVFSGTENFDSKKDCPISFYIQRYDNFNSFITFLEI